MLFVRLYVDLTVIKVMKVIDRWWWLSEMINCFDLLIVEEFNYIIFAVIVSDLKFNKNILWDLFILGFYTSLILI